MGALRNSLIGAVTESGNFLFVPNGLGLGSEKLVEKGVVGVERMSLGEKMVFPIFFASSPFPVPRVVAGSAARDQLSICHGESGTCAYC